MIYLFIDDKVTNVQIDVTSVFFDIVMELCS